MRRLDADSLTWAALLAQCTDFARAATALDRTGDEGRWRESTTAVVALMSVRHALSQIARIDEVERPLARDRADLLITEHAGALDRIWRGEPMPESLLELGDDARRALHRSFHAGATELVWSGPGAFEVPAGVADLPSRIARGDEPGQGTLLVAAPATILMPGTPVAWWTERPWPDVGDAFDAMEVVETDAPRQVYRQLDGDGRITGDVVAPIWREPEPGMPLLVPLLDAGTPVGGFTMDAATWTTRQAAAWPTRLDVESAQLPVRHLADDVPDRDETAVPGLAGTAGANTTATADGPGRRPEKTGARSDA